MILVTTVTAAAGTMAHFTYTADYIHRQLAEPYTNVGAIFESTSSAAYVGSGTLIGKHWVLTAAHMVDSAVSETYHSNTDYIYDGKTDNGNTWYIPPGWNGNLFAGNDIALLHLTNPITNVPTASLYTGNNEAGNNATVVGFGETGNALPVGSGGIREFDGYKRAGVNRIDGTLFQGTKLEQDNILTTRMDVFPDNTAYTGPRPNPNYDPPSSYMPQSNEYMIDHGDSGGPDFNGYGQLIGVHSFGLGLYDGVADSSFSDIGGSTRVSRWVWWIRLVMALVNNDQSVPTSLALEGSTGHYIYSQAQATSMILTQLENSPDFTAKGLAELRAKYGDAVKAPNPNSISSTFGLFLPPESPSNLVTHVQYATTPEPSSAVLLALAGVLMWVPYRRRRRARC